MRTDSATHRILRSARFQTWAKAVGAAMAVAVTVGSAIIAKEAAAPPLAVIEQTRARPSVDKHVIEVAAMPRAAAREASKHAVGETAELSEAIQQQIREQEHTFNGRPIRPARVVWMQVTAYSPGAESCAPFNDGKTATLHSVYTNAMKLVAADTSLLPFGSLVSVPGYDEARVVPVLDRGAAIKGYKLDVLFPTARQARKWGVRKLPVVIWEYADGEPIDDPRAFR